MNGADIRAARERRGWTQQQLATALKVGFRTVGNWERGETVPRNRIGMIREVLDIPDAGPASSSSGDPLRDYTDLALLSELMRRALERQQ